MKQKLLLTLDILLILITAGLVALNLFVCPFPEWVTIAAVVLLAAVNAVYFDRFKTHLIAKFLLPLFSLMAIVVALFGTYANPYWNSTLLREGGTTIPYYQVLSYKEAKADLDYAMHYLQKCHPHCLKGLPEEVKAQYHVATEHLKENDAITVNELRREVQQIFSLMGDAHTTSWDNWDERYLQTIAPLKAGGWELWKVNGRTPEEILADNQALFCCEAESWAMTNLRANLSTLSGLDFLGIDPDGVEYVWRHEQWRPKLDEYTAGNFVTYDKYISLNGAYMADNESFVGYTIDEEKSLALLTLTSCEYNQVYIDCLKEMFAEVKAKQIRNVAVDLRGNGGGNSQVIDEFIRYLPVTEFKNAAKKRRLGAFMMSVGDRVTANEPYSDLVFEGNVILLTDAGTFSSAMMFAEYIKDNGLGTIIGEPPGNLANGCGEIAVFQMPHSGLYFQVSTSEFTRADRECDDLFVMPDVECASSDALAVMYRHLT